MKLSTRKIIGIEAGVVLAWLGLSWVGETLVREYLQIAVLGAALLVSVWLLGWAKPRAREGRLVTTLLVLAALVFQVVWFVFLGLKLGFVQNVYLWNLKSLGSVFLPMGLAVVLEEMLRGQMVAKGHESRAALIVTTLVVVVLELVWVWPVYNLALAQDGFDLIVVVGVPALLKGCLLTYVAYEYDYRANIAYRLIMEMPVYVLPILPDVSQYLTTMFTIALVLALAVLVVRVHGRKPVEKQGERPEGESKLMWKRYAKYGGVAVVLFVIAVYVGLMSGIFKYHLLAIGSGSMEPNIKVGDMVLVEKTDQYDEIEEGDVLVYQHANMVMVHRLVERDERGENYYFKTRGDANDSEDAWWVEQGDVIGVAKGRIVAFGYPTLWLNELFNGGKN